jgi:hypothetical protein
VTGLSRRSFAESLAVTALAPLLGLRPEAIRLGSYSGAPASAPAVGSDPSTLAKALTEVIRTQYGSRLTAGDLTTIRRQIQTGLERVDQLRKVDLSNGDEPDFIFAAIRHPPSPS